nr:1327_t:CDS:2 [Entrophospora candida]
MSKIPEEKISSEHDPTDVNTPVLEEVSEEQALNVIILPIEKKSSPNSDTKKEFEENSLEKGYDTDELIIISSENKSNDKKIKSNNKNNKKKIPKRSTKKRINYSDDNYYKQYQNAFNYRTIAKETNNVTNSKTKTANKANSKTSNKSIIRSKMVHHSGNSRSSRSVSIDTSRNRFHPDGDKKFTSLHSASRPRRKITKNYSEQEYYKKFQSAFIRKLY